MRRKLWIVLGGLAVLAFLTLYLASPILAFNSLSEAARAGDRQALGAKVDFPAVRASLKAQLRDRLMGALGADQGLSQSPFGALGALLAPTLVDQVVEAAVTPDGIAMMARSGRAPLSSASELRPGRALPPPPETAPPDSAAAAGSEPKPKTSFGYAGLNQFEAVSYPNDRPNAPLTWVLERRGMFGWKLVAIELPPA